MKEYNLVPLNYLPRKPLKIEEIPEGKRDCFVFDQQYMAIGRDQNVGVINCNCCNCKKIFPREISDIRATLKRRSLTGLCSDCWHSKGLHQIGIRGTFKNGKHINSQGYIEVWCPDHPKASRGYVKEHRLIMEKYLERFLNKKESVHHINGNRTDNRLENLQLRQGCHGAGIVYKCKCCGSTNVVPAEIS